MRIDQYIPYKMASEILRLPIAVLYFEYRDLKYRAIDAWRAAHNAKLEARNSIKAHLELF